MLPAGFFIAAKPPDHCDDGDSGDLSFPISVISGNQWLDLAFQVFDSGDVAR